jgi:transcriptional regulator with XRE-family HTH domain
MNTGDKLIRLRKEKGWSQNDLAKMLGTSGAIIGRYERSEMVPSVDGDKEGLRDAIITRKS